MGDPRGSGADPAGGHRGPHHRFIQGAESETDGSNKWGKWPLEGGQKGAHWPFSYWELNKEPTGAQTWLPSGIDSSQT